MDGLIVTIYHTFVGIMQLTDMIPAPKYLANKTRTMATPPSISTNTFDMMVAVLSVSCGLNGRMNSCSITKDTELSKELTVLKLYINHMIGKHTPQKIMEVSHQDLSEITSERVIMNPDRARTNNMQL